LKGFWSPLGGKTNKEKTTGGGEGEDRTTWQPKMFRLPSSGIKRGGERNCGDRKVFCRHMCVATKRFLVTMI